MLDRVAELTYGRPKAVLVAVAAFVLVAIALGGGVAERLAPAGFSDPATESIEAQLFREDEIPWDELAFSTTESALRDWLAGLPGRPSAFEPELYVEGDPDE